MGDQGDQILSAIAALQTTADDTQTTVKGLEVTVIALQVKNATQDEQISTCQRDIKGVFKKISDHTAQHMSFYLATVGIVGGMIALARAW